VRVDYDHQRTPWLSVSPLRPAASHPPSTTRSSTFGGAAGCGSARGLASDVIVATRRERLEIRVGAFIRPYGRKKRPGRARALWWRR